MKRTLSAAAFGLAAWLAVGTSPASACLSCGCGGSGTSADLGALGGAAALFSMGSHWLVQESVSFRSITGTFNERGDWSQVPIGGSLYTAQTTPGVSSIPMPGMSFGLQLPLVANSLDQASWGPLGSINPTDLPRSSGAALGDVAVQGTLRLLEMDKWAVAAWTGATAPTGNAIGDPAALSGAGVGASGYRGEGRFGPSDVAFPLGKLKVKPALQYEWSATEGVRLAVGGDPASTGTNTLTDLTAYAVFYQFIP